MAVSPPGIISWQFVTRDTLLVDIETDKVVIEVFAPEDGVLTTILKQGDTVLSEEPIAQFEPGAPAAPSTMQPRRPLFPCKLM